MPGVAVRFAAEKRWLFACAGLICVTGCIGRNAGGCRSVLLPERGGYSRAAGSICAKDLASSAAFCGVWGVGEGDSSWAGYWSSIVACLVVGPCRYRRSLLFFRPYSEYLFGVKYADLVRSIVENNEIPLTVAGPEGYILNKAPRGAMLRTVRAGSLRHRPHR